MGTSVSEALNRLSEDMRLARFPPWRTVGHEGSSKAFGAVVAFYFPSGWGFGSWADIFTIY
jgi:hypothetical protein